MQSDWFLEEFTKSYMFLTVWMVLALLLLSAGAGTKELSVAQSLEERVRFDGTKQMMEKRHFQSIFSDDGRERESDLASGAVEVHVVFVSSG